MASHKSKVLIIGSGPAGYTAAIYSARAMLDPVIISGLEFGGQLMITESIENYPGFSDPIKGNFLMEQMRLQAESFGTKIIREVVVSVDLDQRPFIVETDSGDIWHTDVLIIAMGSKVKWLGLESERILQGFGVSACATCDGLFYRNKEVLVVGGGNTAVEEALHLAKIALKVTLVHRRSSLRSEKILQDRLFAQSNVDFMWNTEVVEIIGSSPNSGALPSVSGVRLRRNDDNTVFEVPIDGVFISIGYKPNTDIFLNKLRLTDSNYIWTAPNSTVTSVPGVFAAGDIADDNYRQAITSAAMGCMAALEAERYLSINDIYIS
ncbi:thioredoxin-disulfide reductase [Candidatus Liberibacter americanus]|uniref:Thioredoxin reductase n=1 Tax=Candidatus Liberibacter americanus str. Sao Paulo TaxID=1261131 RepID=U6B5S5_9HYPH|nr:thioredoxin-disulfide reductase [Candidatus Liberibacter americanus]AHA28208.1 Thioredoxin reductase [Candidatus Liberibacter americanus str. Sao Paulo]EMS36278.1 thioredoxin reductase [Candidatus Liberibacter americanus PW_SP]